MKLKVTIDINKINKDLWSAFVYNHPNGNFFQNIKHTSLIFAR